MSRPRTILSAVLLGILVLGPYSLADALQPVRRYVRSFECEALKVDARGAQCRDADACPSISGATVESVRLRYGALTVPVPRLTEQFPHVPTHVDVRRTYVVSAVACGRIHEVTLLYWGGGNCSGVCEVAVRYEVGRRGEPVRATLLPNARDWQSGAVKVFAPDAKPAHTEWLDPP